MKKTVLMTAALWIGSYVFAANPHQEVDSELFLNPYVESVIKEMSGQLVLDAGCGLAPRAIMAAQNGATVCAVDVKKNMLEQAQLAAEKAGVLSQVSFCQSDLESLPFKANAFDQAFCVNTVATVPATMHMVVQNQSLQTGMGAHFQEIARVMKEGGRLLVAAPASYGVVFTNGTCTDEDTCQHIDEVLAKIGGSEDAGCITKNLASLTEVMRATFVRSEGKLKLVTDDKTLRIGQQIWCKVPEGVVSSFYHSEEECLVAMTQAGLICEEIKRPCFFGNVKYNMWRAAHEEQSLGKAYTTNNPFTIYYAVKKSV